MRDEEYRRWPMLFLLLVAFVPATGNRFLYAFVMLTAARDWELTPFWAAVIGFLPFAAAPIGGMLFGSISDRYGRRKALLLGILLSGMSSGLSGLSFGPVDFALYRLVLGMATGGQWAVSMTLVSEVWPALTRGRAVGIVQTSFPVGFIYASLLAYGIGEKAGWRILLMLGALPALFAGPVCYVMIRESRLWLHSMSQPKAEPVSYRQLFAPGLRRNTVLGTLIMFVGAFGAWSINPWIPAYLGRLGAPSARVPLYTLYVMLGALLGYILYGFISDRMGRKFTFRLFFIGMACALLGFGFLPSQTWFTSLAPSPLLWLVIIGGLVTFFLGYFSGYGALFAELFPTRVRSRGMGFCYTIGGIGAALSPAVTGYLSVHIGMGYAFMLASLPFLAGTCSKRSSVEVSLPGVM
jgi:MFS family permease